MALQPLMEEMCHWDLAVGHVHRMAIVEHIHAIVKTADVKHCTDVVKIGK
jgi:hypothetical protein